MPFSPADARCQSDPWKNWLRSCIWVKVEPIRTSLWLDCGRGTWAVWQIWPTMLVRSSRMISMRPFWYISVATQNLSKPESWQSRAKSVRTVLTVVADSCEVEGDGSQRYFVRMGADLPFYGVSRAREQVPFKGPLSHNAICVSCFSMKEDTEDTQNAMERMKQQGLYDVINVTVYDDLQRTTGKIPSWCC